MVHCTLPAGRVTRAVQHPFLALCIPLDVAFQFRATGPAPLEMVIATMPPWPGEAEAVFVDGPWTA
jgi:hypothetical protein